MSLLFWITSASAAPCPSATDALDQAESAVLELRFDSAAEALREVESAFGCARADASTLGRFHRVEGALSFLDGDPTSARNAFSAARTIEPDVAPTAFGSKVEAAWSEAEPSDGPAGRLTIEPTYGPVEIDLEPSTSPAEVRPGAHLVQVFDGAGDVVFGAIAAVPQGTSVRVRTQLEPPPAPEPIPPGPSLVPETPPPKKKTSPVWLGAGIGAGVLGVGSMVVALDARRAGGNASDVASLDRAFQRERAFGYAAYGLFGLAATGVTLHVAL